MGKNEDGEKEKDINKKKEVRGRKQNIFEQIKVEKLFKG